MRPPPCGAILVLVLVAALPATCVADQQVKSTAAAGWPVALPGLAPPLPPNVTVVASGFSWIENLCFDGNGSMYASERLRGQLLQIRSDGGPGGGYVTTVLLEGLWSLLLGCAVDEVRHPGYVFSVGKLFNGTDALLAVPTANPGNWQMVTTTPKGFCGNGIRIHEKTGRLYTSSEGNFLPGGGAVFEIDLTQPWGSEAATAREVGIHLFASDGLWIDQDRDILYVGLLFTAEVWAYSLATRTVLGTYSGLKHTGCGLEQLCAMDDFTLAPSNSSLIIVCAWTDNSIVTFPTFSPKPGQGQTTILRGIKSPTSARYGSGKGAFASSSLFISEGGGLVKGEHTYRILEWKNAPHSGYDETRTLI